MKNRRSFLTDSAYLTGALTLGGLHLTSCAGSSSMPKDAILMTPNTSGDAGMDDMFFKISLAQWSYHKALWAKQFDHLDFAAKAKSLDIHAIEYVNQFFKDKAEDASYLSEMNTRAADQGVTQVLIMIDGEGGLGDPDDAARKTAVENHYKWVDAAKTLGCHSIRVNAYGQGDREVVAAAAVDGLGGVSEYAAKENINVIVENHGGYSSDGGWLSGVMRQVKMDNCGTLPDFGNFCMKRDPENPYTAPCLDEYDKYKGVEEMMPFAKAVSAKANVFDENGDEAVIDYMKMLSIVKDHGYTGHVGIEYEGRDLDEQTGIIKTRDLLRKVGKALS
ncbi:MAG: sugar phosphate isomerase/epimerase family protein [Bacteroidota bacterium]